MNARFFTALSIALVIFAIRLGADPVYSQPAFSDTAFAVVGQPIKLVSKLPNGTSALQLPRIVVHPTAEQMAEANSHAQPKGLVLGPAVDGASKVIAGRVSDRVSRVSLMIPYYAFGGAKMRPAE